MRSRVIKALSRPRATSRRSVFMLTGMTSCTMGSTKAPPFITTFCPPRPVRTNARSFEERRYSQFISQTTMAITAAITISPRITAPNCAPVMETSSTPDLLELPGRRGQRHLGRQTLHAGGAVEAVALPAVSQDEARVGRPGDRAAVAQDDDVPVHRPRGRRPRIDQRHALLERDGGLGADGAAGGQPEVTDDD